MKKIIDTIIETVEELKKDIGIYLAIQRFASITKKTRYRTTKA